MQPDSPSPSESAAASAMTEQPSGLTSLIPLDAAPTGSFITYGTGADLDAAVDDATSTAWFDLGRAQLAPSIASANPDRVRLVTFAPLPLDVAVLEAQRLLAGLDEGDTIAVPVAGASAFRRRRVQVRLDDAALDIAPVLGPVVRPDEPLIAAVTIAAALNVGEVIGSLELKRHRARFKPVTTKNVGDRTTTWEITRRDTGEVITSHSSQSEARRAAVLAAKSGTPEGGPVVYDITARVTRGDKTPFMSVERARVSQTAVVKVELHTAKEDKTPKVIGYVIAGKGTR